MKKTRTAKCGNLSENSLFEAVAFPDEASAEILRHLESCPSCKREAEDMAGSLAKLGEMSRRSVPAMKRRILLPPEPAKSGSLFQGRAFRVALAAAFVVVFAVTALFTLNTRLTPGIEPRVTEYAENEPLFFEESEAYAQNVLPPDYLEMAGVLVEEDEEAFSDMTYDEDFTDFASPV